MEILGLLLISYALHGTSTLRKTLALGMGTLMGIGSLLHAMFLLAQIG